MAAPRAALNRLARSKSPYLLQHQANPVDWYEWGPEAFAAARKEQKPVFLSVGYSSCHWCHVMAHESFENEAVASVLNGAFINIKVDREERPDVDRLYMTYLQATSGRGGWPMSAFLTPSLAPFFAGTYFSPAQFVALLGRITELWRTDRARIEASGKEVLGQLGAIGADSASSSIDASVPEAKVLSARVAEHWGDNYDEQHGGFGPAPKFPSSALTFVPLLRHCYYAARDDQAAAVEARDMVTHTLLMIGEGGIHDHLGGGFARYSVDEKWLLPHFEKMLYDQAQLLTAMLHASLLHPADAPDRAELQLLCVDIIRYLAGPLAHVEGGFYSAEDADSLVANSGPGEPEGHKKEGAFYVFSAQDLEGVLSGEEYEVLAAHFGVRADGNIPSKHDVQGELVGMNVLAVAEPLTDLATRLGRSEASVQSVLDSAKQKVGKWRDGNRPRPGLDDKLLASWNGLTMSALAHASRSLDPVHEQVAEQAKEMAQAAARFLKAKMWDPDKGELSRSWREGKGPGRGQSDDYAFVIAGLIDLYEATGEEEHLLWAQDLQGVMLGQFWDSENGGWWCSPSATEGSEEGEELVVRMKDTQDGAEPTASAIALGNLCRLAHIFDKSQEEYLAKAKTAVLSVSGGLRRAAYAQGSTVANLYLLERGVKQFVILGSPTDPRTKTLASPLFSKFIPDRVVLFVDPANPPTRLAAQNGVIRALLDGLAPGSVDGSRPNVRVCAEGLCGLPLYTVEEVEQELVAIGAVP